MPSVDVLPDIELVVREWLVDHAAVDALVSGRIATSLPSNPTYPLLTYSRIGGIPAVRQRLDVARIQVRAWAMTRPAASSLARFTRAALLDMEGQTVAGAFITAVNDDLGLAWLPDTVQTPPIPSYVLGVAIYARAA